MLNSLRFTAEVELTIPFHDVDMVGMVWHGNYFRYSEVARKALPGQFNYGYRQMKKSGYLWPVVDAWVKCRHALAFERRIRVRAHIEEFESRLRTGYQIFDAETDKHAAAGYTIQIAVEGQGRELCFVNPDILFERMGVKPWNFYRCWCC